jgi:hypothetical protein
MPKAFVILCAIGWGWTAVAGVYLCWRGRFSDHGFFDPDQKGHGR